MLSLMVGNGCSAREVVYLGDSTTKTVRLRETVKNVKLWVKDKDGNVLPTVGDLPEGGYYRKDLK